MFKETCVRVQPLGVWEYAYLISVHYKATRSRWKVHRGLIGLWCSTSPRVFITCSSFMLVCFYRKSLTLVTITAAIFYVHADNNYYSHMHAIAHVHTDTHAHWSLLLCRTQWLKGRASDSRLRGPGFESCAAVLKMWAIFSSLYIAPVQ